MPAAGDIVELTHEQTYLGQQMNNVYFYEAAVEDASMTDLATWFETNVVPAVKALQVDLVSHVNLRLRNLFNLAETHEEPLTGTGDEASLTVELPSFMALTTRFDHESGLVRPGFKRWGGISETKIEDALLRAATITQMQTLADLLVVPPSVVIVNWQAVIVGRVCDELNPIEGAVPRCLKYVLPRTRAEAEIHGIGFPTTYEVYSQPTTQNSRKWYT